MSYRDDRRYSEGRGRSHGYAADYYDDHPDSRDSRRYDTNRDYRPRQARRPRHEFRRRASSIGGDPSYHVGDYSERDWNPSYHYKDYDSYSGTSSRPSRSYGDRNRRQSTSGSSRANDYDYQDRYRSRDQGSDRRDRDRDRDRDDHSDRSERDQSSDEGNGEKGGHKSFLREQGGQILMHAALPLVVAGAAEAFRSRKEPGEWKGDKGKHILTSAVTNGLVNRDPTKPSNKHMMETGLRGLKEGAPTREERVELQRRVGKSRTTKNLGKVAAAGAVAFAGMELYDRYGRSRSVGRDYDDRDSRYSSRGRSRSVVSSDEDYY